MSAPSLPLLSPRAPRRATTTTAAMDAVLSCPDLLFIIHGVLGMHGCLISMSVSQSWQEAAADALSACALLTPATRCNIDGPHGYQLCGPSFVTALPGGGLCISCGDMQALDPGTVECSVSSCPSLICNVVISRPGSAVIHTTMSFVCSTSTGVRPAKLVDREPQLASSPRRAASCAAASSST